MIDKRAAFVIAMLAFSFGALLGGDALQHAPLRKFSVDTGSSRDPPPDQSRMPTA